MPDAVQVTDPPAATLATLSVPWPHEMVASAAIWSSVTVTVSIVLPVFVTT